VKLKTRRTVGPPTRPVTDPYLRQRIKDRLEEDSEGAVELYEVGPPQPDGRLRVIFYRHMGGESRRWRTVVRIGPAGTVTECDAPSLDP
jgi:hypothetical protein